MSRPRDTHRVVRMFVPLALVGLAAACTHEIGPHAGQPAAPTPVATPAPNAIGGGPAATQETAMTQAIRMRCAREQRCDNIGFKRPYASMDDCVANVAVMHADDFAGLQCDAGVRSEALSECLQEIAREQCVPGARFAACRSIGLCNSI